MCRRLRSTGEEQRCRLFVKLREKVNREMRIHPVKRPGSALRRLVVGEDGALTTEMMILTAVLAGVAIAAAVLLMGAMNDAANQIDVNTTVN